MILTAAISALRQDWLQLSLIAANAKHDGVIQKQDRYGANGRFFPGTHDTLKRFAVDDLIKRKVLNSIYSKINVDNTLGDDEVGVPEAIAKETYVKCDEIDDATHVVYKENVDGTGAFMHKKIYDYKPHTGRSGDIVRVWDEGAFRLYELEVKRISNHLERNFGREIEAIQLYRKGMKDGDLVMVTRHPVKAANCITLKRVKVLYTQTTQYVIYLTNAVVKYLEGDFDGDACLFHVFAPNAILEQHVEKHTNVPTEKTKIILNKFLPPVEKSQFNRLDISALMNIEQPAPFVIATAKILLGLQLDRDNVGKFIGACQISKLLDRLVAYPMLTKAMALKDGKKLKELQNRFPTIDIKINADNCNDSLDVSYLQEELTSQRIEMFARCYFKGYGPKLSGYVQKLLMDVAANFTVVDDKLLYRGNVVYTDPSLKGMHPMKCIELINSIQQDVIGLKHISAPLSNLDKAYALERLFNSRKMVEQYGFKTIMKLFVEHFGLDESVARMSTVMLYCIVGAEIEGTPIKRCNGKVENLTWSWGIANKTVSGTLRRTFMTKNVVNFMNGKTNKTN